MVETIPLRLPCRVPFAGRALLAVLAARAVDGLERVGADGSYLRTLALPHGPAVARLSPGDGDVVEGELRTTDVRDVDVAVARLRHLLALAADPAVVDAHLASDPVLAPLVALRPGLRVLGTVDGFELALRAVIGQQVSVAAARTVLGRVVLAHGEPVPAGLDPDPIGHTLRLLPGSHVVAGLPDEALAMPRARAATVRRVAGAVADGTLDLRHGVDPATATAELLALRGIGPWTASYVAMRGLGDRDAFPASDLVLRQAAASLGLPSDARGLARRAERWAPWRAYAAQHLWAVAAAARTP